ncbi:MAG: acyltransferase family protein [Hyphomicrobiaceae bacterium]
MQYKTEIDGIRAIAVLSVLLFHLNPTFLPGGFLGVDVFFVVSGFLMTKIIVSEIQSDTLSYFTFMARRALRIIPALALWILISLLVGFVILPPDDLMNLAESALSASIFGSNFYFYANTGYFDAAAGNMALLHTWSLGVEGQFYAVWPILLMAIAVVGSTPKLRKYQLGAVTIFFVGLVCYILLESSDPKAAFFFPFGRFCEFAAGAIAATTSRPANEYLAPKPNVATGIGISCIAVLMAYFYFLNELKSHPANDAIFVSVASGILLLVSNHSPPINALLSFPVARAIGKISYSLYLAHWPVIVYFRHYSGAETLQAWEQLMLLSVIFCVSFLSWKLVEIPFRTRPYGMKKTSISALVVAAISVVTGLTIYTAGWPSRLSDEIIPVANRNVMWKWQCPSEYDLGLYKGKTCVLGQPWESAKNHAILWGDSHALHYAPLLDISARTSNTAIALAYGCSPFIDNDIATRELTTKPNYSARCAEKRKDVLKVIHQRSEIKTVYLASFWSSLPKQLKSNRDSVPSQNGQIIMDLAFSTLVRNHSLNSKRIVILGEVPRASKNLLECYRRSNDGCSENPVSWIILPYQES